MGPALAVVELSSIARGHRVADAMLKRAPVRLMRADAISPGKFLVLVEGDVAAVDESFRVGTDVAGDRAELHQRQRRRRRGGRRAHTNRKYSFRVQRRSRVKFRTVVRPSPVGDAMVNDV